MSDYHHRMKMQGETCHQCGEGTMKGDHSSVHCDNPDCTFVF